MTVGKKIALLPIVAVIAIVMVALLMMRDIGKVYDSASYGSVNTVPSFLVLDEMEGKAPMAKKPAGSMGRAAAAARSTPGAVLSGEPLLAILGDEMSKEASFTRF